MIENELWKAGDAAAATGGRAWGDWSATGVSIDTRSLVAGDLFIALQGPVHDGHSFLEKAYGAGAVAAMVHRAPEGALAERPHLLVDDTLGALWRLGAASRSRTKAKVVAVTGSAGKTSTKEALKHCLAAQASVCANVGSLNNHWGVPLSLARMSPSVTFGVFELGMNNPGEILELARLVRPHVGIITNVEAAHIGNFSSLEAIANAKAEVFQAIEPGGTAVLNRDNALYDYLTEKAKAAGIEHIVSFGWNDDADARVLSTKRHSEGSVVDAEIMGQKLKFDLSLPGQHMILNSLAVLSAIFLVGGNLEKAAAALGKLPSLSGRGVRQKIEFPGGSFLLIDDSYNANPASMRASFDVLAHCTLPEGARRIAILGDMLELGDDSQRLHRELAGPLKDTGAKVYCCGTDMAALFSALPNSQRVLHTPDSQSMAALVGNDVRPGDVVLVKGSLGSRMKIVVEALQALGQPIAKAANGS
ncbi:MAG: UDP-N-acetylmuramoylalanyl-D-glutamyl-2,6-diaminopimelate--D-alanyl-D-alanine ligase [Kiloniellales bacterium]|nr:UDP-N-acetylmuramoylalanyl-D-glutamyl-2,6-diaminopimelate--D-alanyl-D-alanine ligase [Kiloniellales bacterium]